MATKSIRCPNRQRDKLMTLMKERAPQMKKKKMMAMVDLVSKMMRRKARVNYPAMMRKRKLMRLSTFM